MYIKIKKMHLATALRSRSLAGLFLCSHRFDAQVSLRSFTHPPPVYVLMLPTAPSLIQQLNTRVLLYSAAVAGAQHAHITRWLALLRALASSLPPLFPRPSLLSALPFLVGQRKSAERQGAMRTRMKKKGGGG